MTTPKTDHLPHVSAGMIWDGVTEYLDENSAWGGTSGSSACTETGLDVSANLRARASPMTWLRRKTDRDGWEQIGVTFDRPMNRVSWTPDFSATTAP